MTTKEHVLSIRMYKEDFEVLKSLAEAEKISVSELVLRVINKEYLGQVIEDRERYWYGHA